jgi:TolB-like protein
MKKFSFVAVFILSVMCLFAEKNLAVATFDVVGNAVTKEESEAITELYITELAATGKVNVVDRVSFDKILKEMKFQSSDWSDSNKTTEIGRAANAEIIARGQIIKLGSKMYLSATIIDVKSAKVLSSARKEFNSIDDIFGLLSSFAREVSVVFVERRIGATGPGGGIIFYIEGDKCLECSEVLGSAKWDSASYLCKNYRGGGFNDWYLPTKDELNLIYENLRKTGIISGDSWYWSSSSSGFYTWVQRFSNGSQDYGRDYEYNTNSVRAVRAF